MAFGSVDFWQYRRLINFTTSIFHQWEQLVASGCINNFRIVAEKAAGVHEGWFFADSDAYKWLDAASRLLKYDHPDVSRLRTLVDNFLELVQKAQAPRRLHIHLQPNSFSGFQVGEFTH